MHDLHGNRQSHHPGHRRHSGHSDFGHGSWFREILRDLRGSGPSVRRGDVRPAILAVLQDEPMHGYQVIRELEERSGGRWRPSAGSIYPTLQLLEDEGLVRSESVEGRRTYSLTEEGLEAARAATAGGAPWDASDAGREAIDVRHDAMELVRAAIQVTRAGSPQAQREAKRILVGARRDMYRLLADDEPAESEG